MRKGQKHILRFDPADFLKEAISEFLESGTNPLKIASVVIKVATGIELMLKGRLERICPALILDKSDDQGLLFAKAFNLAQFMRNPKDLDKVEMKTVTFTTLLLRASRYIDLSDAKQHLEELQKSRNNLVHHRGEVDMWQTNLLLVKHIFPFLEKMGKSDSKFQLRLEPSIWEKIKQIEKLSSDAFTSQLAKKIQHHAALADKLGKRETARRVELIPPSHGLEIIDTTLKCPACNFTCLAAYRDVDVDFEDGLAVGAGFFTTMSCRVCDLELETYEIDHIIESFGEFFGKEDAENRSEWESAMEPPEREYGFYV